MCGNNNVHSYIGHAKIVEGILTMHAFIHRIPVYATINRFISCTINLFLTAVVTVNLSLSLARMRVPEADGSVEILLFKTGENERPVRVRVFTEDLSAQSKYGREVFHCKTINVSDNSVSLVITNFCGRQYE